MSTRICKACGWEHPKSFLGSKCRVCGAKLDTMFCPNCKRLLPISAFPNNKCTCKQCWRPYENAWLSARVDKMHERFDDWVAKVRQVPKSYPALTEAQWLEACRHFDGCARCGSGDIDTRGFFIGASLGGRYCDWNIIPLCEKCASRWDLTKSVFRYTERIDERTKDKDLRGCLEKIVDYLGGKLDDATRYIP